MTNISPELDANELIERIAAGTLPRDFVMLAARGFLPLPQEELVAVLAVLAQQSDEEISETARQSLAELPPRVVLTFARSESSRPELLAALGRTATDPAVVEAILRNRVTPDELFEDLARSGAASTQEIIVTNQERIIRRPEILDALLQNEQITNDVRRRALEVREEFFDKKPVTGVAIQSEVLELEPGEQAPEDLSPIADLLEKAEQAVDTTPLTSDSAAAAGSESIWNQIANMTVAERVQCAFKAGKTARSILVRDRNKLVCTAVVRSPRLTENEVESFAGLRNVEEEVLRLIGMNRQYMSKYPIMVALLRNPKAPVGVVLPYINRLNLKDLKNLASDRGVSEAVRASARKLYVLKMKNQ